MVKPQDFDVVAPGQVVRIADGWAFVPSPLPPDVPVARTFLVAVERARGALSEFVGLARLIQNAELIMAPLRQREAVLSSRIEGTGTQVREVLLAQAEQPKHVGEDSDLGEVLNYLRALEFGQQWVAEGRPLNLTLIRGLHEELMRGVRGQDKHPGAFRTGQVYIGDRYGGIQAARFVPPPPEQVQPLVEDLVRFMSAGPTYGPLIDCAILHYQFEAVHPFEDGNGRLGRLLIPLFLLAANVIDRPMFYLSPYFEQHRDLYISLLNKVSTRGAWEEWIIFFLTAVHRQAEDSKDRVQRVLDLRDRYQQQVREAASSRAAPLAVDLVMERVYVNVSQVADYTRTTYPTARAAIEKLVGLGILVPYERISGSQWWEARELLHTVYEE